MPKRHSHCRLARWLILLIAIILLFGLPAAHLVLAQAGDEPAFSFITWSDSQGSNAALATIASEANAEQPAFTLFIGDLESWGFNPTQMAAWNAALDGGTGLASRTFPVRGNHDGLDTAGWQANFHLRDQASLVGAAAYQELAEDLSYSFDYGNSHFVALDISGDVDEITAEQLAWLDQDLTQAEQRGLAHAFLYFHGPVYCIYDHCDCEETACSPTAGEVAALVDVLNRHPIIAATFHGHEHVMAYTSIDSTRIPEVIHPYAQFISSPAGSTLGQCSAVRTKYCGTYTGYAVIRVAGSAITVDFHRRGGTRPQVSIPVINDYTPFSPPEATVPPSQEPTASLTPSPQATGVTQTSTATPPAPTQSATPTSTRTPTPGAIQPTAHQTEAPEIHPTVEPTFVVLGTPDPRNTLYLPMLAKP